MQRWCYILLASVVDIHRFCCCLGIACCCLGTQVFLIVLLVQEAKKLMEEKFKSGTNKWFFSKLRF